MYDPRLGGICNQCAGVTNDQRARESLAGDLIDGFRQPGSVSVVGIFQVCGYLCGRTFRSFVEGKQNPIRKFMFRIEAKIERSEYEFQRRPRAAIRSQSFRYLTL